MTRFFFEKDEDRNSLFKRIKKRLSEKTWKGVRSNFDVSRSTFQRYRYGKLTIPHEIFSKMLEILPEGERKFFKKKVSKRSDNWGERKGGKITYKKHKNIFKQGRERGIKKLVKNTKEENWSEIELSKEFCEFLGAFIGDGFTAKYGSSYLIQFTGHAKLDKNYYSDVIIPCMKNILDIKPSIKIIENTLRVNFYSKRLYTSLTERFNFPSGKKSYTVRIPDEILNSKNTLILSLIRGIFDTDGSIHFDKRDIYESPYPRIELDLENPKLIREVKNIFVENGFNPAISGNDKRLYLNGIDEIKKYFKKIGFSNKRHINRVEKEYPSLVQINDASVAQLARAADRKNSRTS